MENTFENALAYVAQLKGINSTLLQDDKAIASALMLYSAKTNKPTIEMLKEFAEKFRQWRRQWDLYGKQEIIKKPKNIDEFIDEFLLKWTK